MILNAIVYFQIIADIDLATILIARRPPKPSRSELLWLFSLDSVACKVSPGQLSFLLPVGEQCRCCAGDGLTISCLRMAAAQSEHLRSKAR